MGDTMGDDGAGGRAFADLGRGKDFLVVGLGGSAGAISAFKEFFHHMPPRSGMAYVVILHLSPEYESQLTEVLQQATEMPVEQVVESVRVEPDRVYVIPPNKSLSIIDGSLKLSDVTGYEERRAPVDIFFRTLAESHHSRAVAVVVSGTGANGSMGLKRVKENGGLVLVQEPSEAEFNEMPRNSIRTGLVDQVLPVSEMPARIKAYRDQLDSLRLPEEAEGRAEGDERALVEIFTTLRVRTGHDFSDYKRGTVMRRIARRMGVQELPDLPAYARYLREQREEAHSLLKDLLISVTNFFRDGEAFAALERRVIPRLFDGKGPEDQVRVWAAACATGEEAYSVAMLLCEYASTLPSPPAIQVFGTDLDEAAVAHARRGHYTLNDVADVSPERLREFFVKEGEGFTVRRELRETLLFVRHNLIKDPPFSRLDLVTCRNLLIYFNRAAQRRATDVLYFALKPAGYLFLGTSETLEGAGDLFATCDKEQHIYQSRGVMPRAKISVELSPSLRVDRGAAAERAPQPPALRERTPERLHGVELHRRLLEVYGAPSVVVNEDYDIIHLSERAGRYMQFSAGEGTLNLLRVVRPELSLDLRAALLQAAQEQTSVEARGLVVEAGGQSETVNLVVRPALGEGDPARGFFLVLFERGAAGAAEKPAAEAVSTAEPAARRLEGENERLRLQMRTTVEQYETQTEELKAANEELQAVNEELRSTTEELETSKEELQSVNEELHTVNQELKNKIEELTHANDDMRNLIGSTQIGTVFLDRSLRIKLFTPRARDIFNLISADVGRPLRDITSQIADGDLASDAESVITRLHTVEREVGTRDGRFYLMQLSPYRTAEDRIEGVVLTFVEITRRWQAEKALLEARQSLEVALDASRTGVWDLNLTTGKARTDSRHNQIFGYAEPVEDWSPEAFVEHILPEDTGKFERAYERAMKTGVFDLEVRVRWPDGSVHWIYDRGRVYYDDEGRPRRMAGATLDITERKQTEEALRASEERLRLVIESVEDYAIFTTDMGGRIETWNAGARGTFGYAEDEAVGQDTDIIFTPEDRERGAPEEERRRAREEGRAADERWHMSKQGARFYVSGVLVPLRGADGELTGYAKIARDLTERKKLEDALRSAHDDMEERVRERTAELRELTGKLRAEVNERTAAERQVRELLRRLVTIQENERRRIARELHDQLGQQMTALRLKLESVGASGRGRALLERVRQAQALAAEIDSNVDFLAWEMRPASLDELGVEAALQNFVREWAKQFGVEAAFHSSGFEDERLQPEVEANLYRILQEALQNVHKHAGADRVDVLLERRDGEAVLIVEDNGKGYDAEREVARDSNKGMGVVNMRERATLVGGALEMESTPGRGTTIFVRVPFKAEPPAPADGEEPRP
jgi:two-component system, chemotaxis family, CheB/CheR fusion protein